MHKTHKNSLKTRYFQRRLGLLRNCSGFESWGYTKENAYQLKFDYERQAREQYLKGLYTWSKDKYSNRFEWS